jgi:hypothetical protein
VVKPVPEMAGKVSLKIAREKEEKNPVVRERVLE